MLIPLVLYCLLPLLGVAVYVQLHKRMAQQMTSVPAWHLLVVMSTYGGWLLVLLTTLFWQWSGMASLGTFYLLFVAPFLLLAVAFRTARQPQLSGYHRWIFRASALYLPIVAGALLLALLK